MFPQLFGGGKRKRGEPNDVLHFKDADAAFEYACMFGDTELREGANLFSIVIPSGVGNADILEDERGIQTCMIKVSDEDAGHTTIAQTAGRNGPRLKIGDAVIWHCMERSAQLDGMWMGLIVAKVEPSLSIAQGWKIVGGYHE